MKLRNMFAFATVAIGAGWLGRWIDAASGIPVGQGPGMAIWILAPFVASLLLRGLAGDGWRDLGIRPRIRENLVWYVLSALVYPVFIALVMLVGLVSGFTILPDFSAAVFLQAVLAMLGFQMVKNILEEFSFRGYLAPKIYKVRGGTITAHLLVGLVWGLWHLPYLRAITPYTTEPLATLAPRFILGTMAASLVYGEIRLRTGSVWPAWLMHTAGAVTVGGLMAAGSLGYARAMEFVVAPVLEGALMIALFVIIGVRLYRLRTRE